MTKISQLLSKYADMRKAFDNLSHSLREESSRPQKA